MLNESMSLKSDIEIIITDAKTKEVLDVKHYHNILTNNGKKWIRNQLANIPYDEDGVFNVETRLTHIALGDESTPVSVNQTALGNELIRKEVYPNPDTKCEIVIENDDKVIYVIFLAEGEGNGKTFREIGLFAESNTNFMVSRALIGNLTKNSSVEFTIKYQYTITSAGE